MAALDCLVNHPRSNQGHHRQPDLKFVKESALAKPACHCQDLGDTYSDKTQTENPQHQRMFCSKTIAKLDRLDVRFPHSDNRSITINFCYPLRRERDVAKG